MTTDGMSIDKILSRAISDGVTLLPEDEGKSLLARFGLRAPRGLRALNGAEAKAAEKYLGYPLVVKALVPGLAHKTELGAVKLGIQDEAALENAVFELQQTFTDAPLLVEQMAGPGVELIAGLANDAHFGPSLMLGIGGILTEVFQDVQFLLLPATKADIRGALTRLRGYRLLTDFRGRAAGTSRACDALKPLRSLGLATTTTLST
jgi:acyl-CoA synthetase (NDP forming)